MNFSTPKRMIDVALAVIIVITLLHAPYRVQADDPTPSPLPPAPTLSTTPISLTVNGTVTGGTAALPIPSGLPISLHVARAEKPGSLPSEILKRVTMLNPDGKFHFDNILALPGDIVFATTSFEGIVQGSPLVQLSNGQATLDLPVTLYGLTSDPGVITLIRVQHIIDFKTGGVLQILATYDYKNTSDRLYLSTDKTAKGVPISVYVPLPVGARAIGFNTQPTARFTVGGDINAPIVQDTKAIVPGQVHEIVFSYQLPYSKGAPIDQDYPYNTTSLEVLIPDDINVGFSDDRFTRAPNTDINPKRPYTQYALKAPLKAGDRLVYKLGGVAQTTPASQPKAANTGLSPVTLIGIAGVLTVFIVVGFTLVQRRLRRGKRR